MLDGSEDLNVETGSASETRLIIIDIFKSKAAGDALVGSLKRRLEQWPLKAYAF